MPTGAVAITLNSVRQNATIQSNGSFSSSFNTATLGVTNSPYTITYNYGGDGNFNGVGPDTSKTLTVTKATATVTFNAGTLSQTYDDTVKTVATTTNPAGLTVNLSFTGTPQNVGSYPVTATINDANYQGSARNIGHW